MTVTPIRADMRLTLTVRELLTLPQSPQRDALIRRTTMRALDAESRDMSTAAWVARVHAEAEQHRRQAARDRHADHRRRNDREAVA